MGGARIHEPCSSNFFRLPRVYRRVSLPNDGSTSSPRTGVDRLTTYEDRAITLLLRLRNRSGGRGQLTGDESFDQVNGAVGFRPGAIAKSVGHTIENL